MKRTLIVTFVLCLFVFSAAAVFANVTFDPNTGTGFVGKGDVQSAFGWNNRELQAEANNVSFSYDVTNTYVVTACNPNELPDGQVICLDHTDTQNISTVVRTPVASQARNTGQYTGWNLTGLDRLSTTVVLDPLIPNVGDSCPDGYPDTCRLTAVDLVSSTGGLFVSDAHLGLRVQIWP